MGFILFLITIVSSISSVVCLLLSSRYADFDLSGIPEKTKVNILLIYFATLLCVCLLAIGFSDQKEGKGWLRGRQEIEKRLIEIGACKYKLNETTGVIELHTVK